MIISWILVGIALQSLAVVCKQASDRPRNVAVEQTNTNGTGLQVTWDAPDIDVTSLTSCPLHGYVVLLKSARDGLQQVKKWNVDGHRRSLMLHDVKEATTYHVRVSTVRCRGASKSSRWVTVHTRRHQRRDALPVSDRASEDAAPGKPLSISTTTFSDYVILTWEPPAEHVTIRGYTIGYGEGVPDVSWQYVEKDNRNVTIRDLKPATQYVLSVRAFNNFGKGPVVYDLVYTKDKSEETYYTCTELPTTSSTLSALTNAIPPPSNLRAKVLSPTTIWLQWTDPSLGRHQHISDNRYYNVHYQALPNSKTLSVIVKALHVVLYDLASGTDYAFKVRTVNDAASSAFSVTVHNKTFSAVPSSPPRGLEVFHTPELDTSSVIVRWKPPKSSGSDVTGYLLAYTSEPEVDKPQWRYQAVAGTMLETTVSNLHAGLTYYFKVQATNSMGYGPFSEDTAYAVSQASWRTAVANDSSAEVHDHLVAQNLFSAPKEDLSTKNTKAKVAPEAGEDNDDDEDDWQAPPTSISSDAPPPPPLAQAQTGAQAPGVAVTALVRHRVSAVISWKAACDTRHSGDTYVPQPHPLSSIGSINYSLRYYDTQTPGQQIELIQNTNVALIDGLLPNRLYKYHVTAVARDSNVFLAPWSIEGVLNTTVT